MRKISFYTLPILFFVNYNVYAQTIPDGLDGKLDYKDNSYIDFSKSSKAITRSSNRVSIKLDSIVYFLPEKKDYYVNFIIELYNDKNASPQTSMSYLIKDVISNRQGKDVKQILTNQTLASNIKLHNTKFLKIKCELHKISNNQDALNNTLDKYLNQIIESVPYVNLVNSLLNQMSEKEKENKLFFNKEYDIPLNNVEYSFKLNSDDKTRLLNSSKPLYIPINNNIKNEYLDPSVAGFIFSKLCQISKLVSGVEANDGKTYNLNGMIKLRLTNDDNLNIPKYLQAALIDYSLSITPDNISTNDFTKTKENLKEKLRTFKESEDYDQKIYFSIQQLMTLGESYKKLLDKDKIINSSDPNSRVEFQDFYKTFKEFYDRTSYQQDQFDFLAYGIYDSIYKTKWARIFIPYSLPDIINNEMIRWQISIHERLSSFNSGEFSIQFK